MHSTYTRSRNNDSRFSCSLVNLKPGFLREVLSLLLVLGVLYVYVRCPLLYHLFTLSEKCKDCLGYSFSLPLVLLLPTRMVREFADEAMAAPLFALCWIPLVQYTIIDVPGTFSRFG